MTWSVFVSGYVLESALSSNGIGTLLGCVLIHYFAGFSLLKLSIAWLLDCMLRAYRKQQTDFQAFLDLGPGGTPSTPAGFKRITLLAWFGRINVHQSPRNIVGTGKLDGLPLRQGHRPIVGGIAPQRQLDQRNSEEVFGVLLDGLALFAASFSDKLYEAPSFLEKSTTAILSHCDCVSDTSLRTFGGEICHPHYVDGSMHVILHPADVAKVIECGWGERHPLARADGPWNFWFLLTEQRPPVPEQLCFVYAPRTYEEVEIVMRIVEAGAKFVADTAGTKDPDGHTSCPNHHPRPVKRRDSVMGA